MLPRFVLASILALGAIALLQVEPGGQSQAAATCIMVLTDSDPWKRPEGRLDYAELVLVGTIVSETPIRTEIRNADLVVTLLEPSSTPSEGGRFQSTVRIDAVLKGDTPDAAIDLPLLSDTWACVGGPRLQKGSTVLLLLNQEATFTFQGEPRGHIWATGPGGGNVLFAAGEAQLDDYISDGRDLGPSEDVVRFVGARLGASDEAVERSLAAIGSAQASRGGFSWLPLLVIGGAALGGVAALALAARFRRRWFDEDLALRP